MLLKEYAAADAAALRDQGAACIGGAEIFVRDDGKGGAVICGGGTPGGAPDEKQLEVLFAGGRFGKQGGDWLFCVGLWTPPDFRDEFLAWYRMEHLPILLECPAWDGCRFTEQKVEKGSQFYAMHQLADKAALDSDERRRSRATPWFLRLAKHEWFDGAFVRVLYKRLNES
jgi:hypothetical protein